MSYKNQVYSKSSVSLLMEVACGLQDVRQEHVSITFGLLSYSSYLEMHVRHLTVQSIASEQ